MPQFELAEEWEAAIAEGVGDADDGDARARGALDEVRQLSVLALMLVARGDPTDDLLARLEEASSQLSDPFAVASLHGVRSDRAFVAGDFATAYDEAMLAAEEPQVGAFYLDWAARAALAAGDVARARVALERLQADPATDAPVETARVVTRAGVAALEGRRAEAISGYLDALARCRARRATFDIGRYALELVRRVGPEEPAVRAAADEARAIFVRVAARPYLAALDAAMGAQTRDGARAATVTAGTSDTDAALVADARPMP